jgi:hypothetical protein
MAGMNKLHVEECTLKADELFTSDNRSKRSQSTDPF